MFKDKIYMIFTSQIFEEYILVLKEETIGTIILESYHL